MFFPVISKRSNSLKLLYEAPDQQSTAIDSEMDAITKQFEHVSMTDLVKTIAEAATEKSRHVVFLVDEVCRVVHRPDFSTMLSEFKR